jgi:hypothetical protein
LKISSAKDCFFEAGGTDRQGTAFGDFRKTPV